MVKQIVSLLAIASIALAQTVDLGYAKYSVTKDYINVNLWSNIRYAAPPIGSLRFAPPAAPLTEDAVNDGSIGYTCRKDSHLQTIDCSTFSSSSA